MKNRDWVFNATIGYRPTWNAFFFSYCAATDSLYSEIERTKFIDRFAYPFLFLVRHTIELGFKANIYELSKYSEEDFGLTQEGTFKDGHILPPLHQALVKHFEIILKDNGIAKDPNVKEFHKLSKKLGKLVKYFDRIDTRSFSFRYPVDNNGVVNIQSDEVINLKELKKNYDEVIVVLQHTQDVFNNLFIMIDENKKAMNGHF